MDNDKEPIGSWTSWARYVIQTLKTLCESIETLEARLDDFIKKDDCKERKEEIETMIAGFKISLGTATTDLLKLSEQFKGHIEKHEYKWKILAGIATVLAILATILAIIDRIGN
jgi:hypothetical protein